MCQAAQKAGASSRPEFAVPESAMGQGRGTVAIKTFLLCAFACQPASPLARRPRLLGAKKRRASADIRFNSIWTPRNFLDDIDQYYVAREPGNQS